MESQKDNDIISESILEFLENEFKNRENPFETRIGYVCHMTNLSENDAKKWFHKKAVEKLTPEYSKKLHSHNLFQSIPYDKIRRITETYLQIHHCLNRGKRGGYIRSLVKVSN